MAYHATSNKAKAALNYYDGLRLLLAQQNVTLDRSDVISVSVTNSEQQQQEEEEATTYDLRHIVSFQGIDSFTQQLWMDCAAASLLAIRHFNNGITSIVPEIADVSDSCDIRFTMEFFETMHSTFVTSNAFVRDVVPRKEKKLDPIKPFPTGILGAIYSSVSATLGILSGPFEIPQLSPASTAAFFDNKMAFPLFARLIPSDAADVVVAVDYLVHKLGVTHCGILYVRNAYGLSVFQNFEVAAAQSDPPLQFVSSSIPENPTEKDLSDAMRPLKQSEFRYFFGAVYDRLAEPVMIQAYNDGIAGKNNTFWMFGEGAGSFAAYNKDTSSPKFIDATHGAVQLMVASEQQIIDERDSLKSFMTSWEQEVISSPDFQEYMRAKIPGDTSGWSPSAIPLHYALISYDSAIALALASCRAKESKDALFDGKALYEELVDNTKFRGTFGSVAFNPRTGGRKLLNLPYAVKNILTDDDSEANAAFSIQLVDIYEEKNDGSGNMEWRSISPLMFPGGATTPHTSLPPPIVKYEKISSGALITGYFLCGLVMLLSLVFAGWSRYHKNTSVIKKSQPFFLIMLCSGTLILGSAIIPLGFQEPSSKTSLDIACQSWPWLLSTGFIITFSALFSKTNRIYKLFNSGSHTRLTLTTMDVMRPFVILFSLNLILLTLWTAIDPLEYVRSYSTTSFDQFGRPLKSWGTCKPSGNASYVFLALLATLDIGVLIYANVKAYEARHITTEFSESHFIALSMASILQISLFGIPVLFVDTSGSRSANFLIQCFLISVIGLAVLLLIFVPKFYYFREWRKKQKEKQRQKEEKRKRNLAFQTNVTRFENEDVPSTGSTLSSCAEGLVVREILSRSVSVRNLQPPTASTKNLADI